MSGTQKDRPTRKELEQALAASLEQLEQMVAAGKRKSKAPRSGLKKRSTIRQEFAAALAVNGEDPIARLERQIVEAKSKGERTEGLEMMKRFLESPPQRTTQE